MPEVTALVKEIAQTGLADWDAAPFLEKVTGLLPNIIYVFNQKTQSNEYSNRSLGVSLGYSAQEVQALGDQIMPMLCHPADLPRIGAYFAELQKLRDGDVSQIEYRMKHKNGSWVWLLSYDTIFERDTNGMVLRHIGVATDITAQKKAEEKAIQEMHTAEAANEELSAFTYAVSHDMKSPSNTLELLLGELQSQHTASMPEDARQLVEMSLDTVSRMQLLVEDVLNFTRVVDAHEAFDVVALNTILDGVLRDLRADIVASGASVRADPLPLIEGNATQIRILFQNLISNALKFHEGNTRPSVTVRVSATNDDDAISIAVIDNGIGIAQEDQDRIFGLFKRLHLQDDFSGTGLGLSICKRVVSNHCGQISVDSAVGEGTTFTVKLPLRQPGLVG